MSDGIVIAGGGLAAQRCCETLRAKGWAGAIRVVCAEPLPPYDRPPLSKELLAGEMPVEALALRPRDWYREHEVDLILGTRATALDLGERRLELSVAAALRYERLLIATGAAPRPLPLLEGYSNAGPLRTLADTRRLEHVLRMHGRLAVVGAGFIGLEVAATARARGAEVTIVEAAAAPLAAVLGTKLGSWFAELHRAEGAEVLTGARIDRVRGRNRVRELVLADGRRIACDHVLVGVGVDAATRWLAGSGLDPAGVPVDPCGRTDAPDVFAAGDAARPYDPALGRHVRTEHWEAAARQGAAAARAMLGLEPAPIPPAGFWSDQYGTRVQYVGYATEADRVVVDGDPAGRDFQAEFTRAGATVAVLLAGRPRALAEARRRVQAGLDQLKATTTRSGP
jgi:3-phenylpropionate/trans-cinnamate dioxygenase ferredoxin reductase subunit